MICYYFAVTSTQKLAENELLQNGFVDLYTIEEDSKLYIGAFHGSTIVPPSQNVTFLSHPTNDWGNQAALFSPSMKDGLIQVNLRDFIPNIELFGSNTTHLSLIPGQAFGDLSHETTQLMLKLFTPDICNKTVVDIGSGSGILSLAAKALGAKNVIGVDIDPQAINLAQKNAIQNNLEVQYLAKLPEIIYYQEDVIFLLNMLPHEQSEVFKAYPKLQNMEANWIISGILEEKLDEYLSNCLLKTCNKTIHSMHPWCALTITKNL